MTKCEDMNLSLFDYSCMNSSNEYPRDMEHNFDTINLVQSIFNIFKNTVYQLGLIMNIMNIVAISNAPSKLTPHLRLVISLAVSDMCIVLPKIVFFIMLNKFKYDSFSYECHSVFAYFYFEPSVN